jgi:hypothetical protein
MDLAAPLRSHGLVDQFLILADFMAQPVRRQHQIMMPVFQRISLGHFVLSGIGMDDDTIVRVLAAQRPHDIERLVPGVNSYCRVHFLHRGIIVDEAPAARAVRGRYFRALRRRISFRASPKRIVPVFGSIR